MAILIDKFILELRLKTTICKNSQIIECVHVIASLQEQKAPALLSYKIPLPLMHSNSWLDRSFPHFKVKIKVVASNVFSVDGNKPGIFKNVFYRAGSTEHLIKTDLVAISYQSSCGHSCSKFTIFIHESKKFGTKVMVVAKQLSK